MPDTPLLRLNCCQGRPAPDFVPVGWGAFMGLPADAKEHFWDVLLQPLLEPENPRNADVLNSFCRDHDAPEDGVLSAVQSLSFLLRRGAALNMAPQAMRTDLSVLSGGETEEAELILSRYEIAKERLRQIVVRDTLAHHGKLYMGLSWRIDNVVTSSFGVGLNVSVVLLTLQYMEGDEVKRFTLQLPQSALKDFQAFCERFRT